MHILYLDESGSVDPHTLPIQDGTSPLFVLAGLSIPADSWLELDRQYLYLKRNFFSREIEASRWRSENWEVKGRDLTAPRNSGNRRNHRFLERVFELCQNLSVKTYATIFCKDHVHPTPRESLYTMGVQYLVERFSAYLETMGEKGVIIADARTNFKDRNVAISILSYMFGSNLRELLSQTIVEAPSFLDSRVSHGIQLVDIIAACYHSVYYARNCSTLAGAPDYTHMLHYKPMLDALEWERDPTDHRFPRRSLRVVDHSRP